MYIDSAASNGPSSASPAPASGSTAIRSSVVLPPPAHIMVSPPIVPSDLLQSQEPGPVTLLSSGPVLIRVDSLGGRMASTHLDKENATPVTPVAVPPVKIAAKPSSSRSAASAIGASAVVLVKTLQNVVVRYYVHDDEHDASQSAFDRITDASQPNRTHCSNAGCAAADAPASSRNVRALKQYLCQGTPLSPEDLMIIRSGAECTDSDALQCTPLTYKADLASRLGSRGRRSPSPSSPDGSPSGGSGSSNSGCYYVLVRKSAVAPVSINVTYVAGPHQAVGAPVTLTMPANTRVSALKQALFRQKLVPLRAGAQQMMCRGHMLRDECILGDFLISSSDAQRHKAASATSSALTNQSKVASPPSGNHADLCIRLMATKDLNREVAVHLRFLNAAAPKKESFSLSTPIGMLREVIARFGFPKNLPVFFYLHTPSDSDLGSKKKPRSALSAPHRDKMTLLEPTKTLNDYDVDGDVTISVLPDLLEEDSDRMVEAAIESMLGLPAGAVVAIEHTEPKLPKSKSTTTATSSTAATAGADQCRDHKPSAEQQSTTTLTSTSTSSESSSAPTAPQSKTRGGLFSGFKKGFALSSNKTTATASKPTAQSGNAATATSSNDTLSASSTAGASASKAASSASTINSNSTSAPKQVDGSAGAFKGLKRGFLNMDSSSKSTKQRKQT